MKKFLAFQVDKETWEYRVMSFRLSIAPQIFTRLISALLTRLTLLEVAVLVYLDTFFIVVESKEECVSHIVRDVFQEAGFIINVGKSLLVPE